MTQLTPATPAETVDPRSPRFGAVITSVVLLLTVLLGPAAGLPLLVAQTIVFGIGALLGLRYHPYGWLYRKLVLPRLAPPAEREDARPPRFAQGVGLVFAVVALAGAVLALPVVFYLATAFALAAAVLNAVFDFCLGCELYLLGKRLTARPAVVEER